MEISQQFTPRSLWTNKIFTYALFEPCSSLRHTIKVDTSLTRSQFYIGYNYAEEGSEHQNAVTDEITTTDESTQWWTDWILLRNSTWKLIGRILYVSLSA